jgi:hypothetical protein
MCEHDYYASRAVSREQKQLDVRNCKQSNEDYHGNRNVISNIMYYQICPECKEARETSR